MNYDFKPGDILAHKHGDLIVIYSDSGSKPNSALRFYGYRSPTNTVVTTSPAIGVGTVGAFRKATEQEEELLHRSLLEQHKLVWEAECLKFRDVSPYELMEFELHKMKTTINGLEQTLTKMSLELKTHKRQLEQLRLANSKPLIL